jgi:molybdopterin-guanine dinucleotide biosynthesis protein A
MSPESQPADSQPADSQAASVAGPTPRWDAIIVAGGRARRLGGIDKTALVWRGRRLLDGVLAAASGARRICVVGSEADLPASVLRTIEEPRWGGPAAAIVAGLEALANADALAGSAADGAADEAADWVVLLAGDLVRADDAVAVLLAELERVLSAIPVGAEPHRVVDGVVSVDSGGRRQPLLAVYRRSALTSVAKIHASVQNMSVTGLMATLTLVELHLPEALTDDIDTPADAARLGVILPPSVLPPAAAPQTP